MGKLKSNFVATESALVNEGQVAEIIGKGSVLELYSIKNFQGSANVLLYGYEKDAEQPSWKFTCSSDISSALRECETEDEFDEVMNSLLDATVLSRETEATDRNGKVIFDKDGDPKMATVYHLTFDRERDDMSASRSKSSTGKAKEVKKERNVFSFEQAIAGMV